MRSVLLSIVITVVATVAFAAVTADEVTGKWSLSVAAPGEAVEVLLDLKQEGENVTGTMASTHGSGTISKGSYKEKKLSATINADIQGNPTELGLEGTVDGDKISGSLTATGLGTFPYSGSRSK
ncbi:MAG TPA: hypothetical protein VFZ49_03175 [Pyrinomonadaceae bacterium]